MKFEFEAERVVLFQDGQLRHVFVGIEVIEAPVADRGAPMIEAVDSQDGITQSELGFSEIAANEISVFFTYSLPRQQLANEQQTGATVEQEPGSLG